MMCAVRNGLVRYAETPRLMASMALASVESARDDDHGQAGGHPAGFADDGQSADARHLQVGHQQVVRLLAQALDRRGAVGGSVDVVVRPLERLAEHVQHRLFVVDDEDAAAAVAALGGVRAHGAEPGVEILPAEAPLAADADGGDLAGLDEPVHRPEVDLQVVQNLFGGQEILVGHRIAGITGAFQLRGQPSSARWQTPATSVASPGWVFEDA